MREHPTATVPHGVAGDPGGELTRISDAELIHARQGVAAPATGVTGTAQLPALPHSALADGGEVGIVPAAAFSMSATTATDRARALLCLTSAIYYEAASEPDAGQRAVAQVVLNRVRHPAFPATVCGVVYQGAAGEAASAGCQFSFACDGATARVPSRTAWTRATGNAAMMLAGYVYKPVGLATHYHTYAVTPAWNRSLVMTDVVGAHFFHRWKGYWGTSAAFTQRYRGGEPMPGGSLQSGTAIALAAAEVSSSPTPLLPSKDANAVSTQSEEVSAPNQRSTETRDAVKGVEHDALPPRSEILDRWKDSGKPL